MEWPAVETLAKSAQAASELERLDTLVPEALCCNGQAGGGHGGGAPPRSGLRRPRHRQDHHGGQASPSWWETGRQRGKAPADPGWVAPTGKAARGLTESIGAPLQALGLPPEWVQAIPTEARRAPCTGCSG